MEDAKASDSEEGRSERRNAPGRGKRSKIRGCPNGVTPLTKVRDPRSGGEAGEVKHLSSRREKKSQRFSE